MDGWQPSTTDYILGASSTTPETNEDSDQLVYFAEELERELMGNSQWQGLRTLPILVIIKVKYIGNTSLYFLLIDSLPD
ncbi:hypothetical protein TorRG33x02_171400 [Trema orientale]|uniref:Uncharacterized protein n=1 Tax=Trema orientale TaxID=63057 RepID=A0A2P5ENA2_TREOI|nr:hypothetical protein TorRG33x02_171400 [Trema orientale]